MLTLVECNRCQKMFDGETAWISDEGVLCPNCCKNLYPEKFIDRTPSSHRSEHTCNCILQDLLINGCKCGGK